MEDDAEKAGQAGEKRDGEDLERLQKMVDKQSAALDAAYSHIRNLERQQREKSRRPSLKAKLRRVKP
jgi:hypothetical protein